MQPCTRQSTRGAIASNSRWSRRTTKRGLPNPASPHEISKQLLEIFAYTQREHLTNIAVAVNKQPSRQRVPNNSEREKSTLSSKRLTNTPVRQARSVLKCPDVRKKRVVSAQATYPCGSSAVGGRVCEQRYAAERILPESRFELQHTGSPSKETALEEKA
jgi:hypothetical protein